MMIGLCVLRASLVAIVFGLAAGSVGGVWVRDDQARVSATDAAKLQSEIDYLHNKLWAVRDECWRAEFLRPEPASDRPAPRAREATR